MGNICDAMGITRREQGKIGFSGDAGGANTGGIALGSQDGSAAAGKAAVEPEVYKTVSPETKSPVVSAATANPSAQPAAIPVSPAMNAAELKAAYAKKQIDDAAATAAQTVATGPRIRLLPHQHTLFCERKQRVCSAVGQLQEMEVVALEGFQLGTPPFTWIRIAAPEIAHFSEDFEGLIEPAWYTELPPQQLLDERGHRTHGDCEYVLTREDVGYYIGVRYDVEMTVTVDVAAEQAHTSSAAAALPNAAAEQAERESGTNNENNNSTADAVHSKDLASADEGAAAVLLAGAVAEHGQPADTSSNRSSNVAPDMGAQVADVAPAAAEGGAATPVLTRQEVHVVHKYLALTRHGPVKPGPPRLTDFDVSGTMKIGSVAVAEVSYIGGYEGLSEYWWMRISPEGKRTQVTEPRRVPFAANAERPRSSAEYAVRGTTAAAAPVAGAESGAVAFAATDAPAAAVEGEGEGASAAGPVQMAPAEEEVAAAAAGTAQIAAVVPVVPLVDDALLDPRLYLLTEDDLGCCLKAKCRPTRSDGAQGEIFTSSSSEEVTA